MSLRQRLLNSAVMLMKHGIHILGRNQASFISAQVAEMMSPIVSQCTGFGEISFFCPGRLPVYRAQTMLTKEPETIEWINTFEEHEILWDIGANVGTYSLYAGLKKTTVLAFEPSSANYYLLNRNIEINKMASRISALSIAFNDATGVDSFYMANTELGGALNSFSEPISWQGETFVPSFEQSVVGFTIDDFIEQFNPSFPNHIKIDVDGIEGKIIEGARETLKDKRVKSMLVELDVESKESCDDVISKIENCGLKFVKKEHAPEVDNTEFSGSYNHIFKRS